MRPQHRHRLHRGEHQVVAGHRLPPRPPLLRGVLELDRIQSAPDLPAADTRPASTVRRTVSRSCSVSRRPSRRSRRRSLRITFRGDACVGVVQREPATQPGRPGRRLARSRPAATSRIDGSASGCRPSPNKFLICASVTAPDDPERGGARAGPTARRLPLRHVIVRQ